jgi:hypothetical protein
MNDKVVSRFQVMMQNGKPVIKTVPSTSDVTNFVLEFEGSSVQDNIKAVLKYVYDECWGFSEGFAAVRKGDYWGFVSLSLNEVVEPVYLAVESVNEGFASYKEGAKYGFLAMTGCAYPYKWAPAVYDSVHSFKNGMAVVQKDGLYGYVSKEKQGVETIECKFDFAYDFKLEYPHAVVKYNGKFGMINKKGEFVVEPIFDSYECYSTYKDGSRYNAKIGDKFYLMSDDGTVVEC